MYIKTENTIIKDPLLEIRAINGKVYLIATEVQTGRTFDICEYTTVEDARKALNKIWISLFTQFREYGSNNTTLELESK